MSTPESGINWIQNPESPEKVDQSLYYVIDQVFQEESAISTRVHNSYRYPILAQMLGVDQSTVELGEVVEDLGFRPEVYEKFVRQPLPMMREITSSEAAAISQILDDVKLIRPHIRAATITTGAIISHWTQENYDKIPEEIRSQISNDYVTCLDEAFRLMDATYEDESEENSVLLTQAFKYIEQAKAELKAILRSNGRVNLHAALIAGLGFKRGRGEMDKAEALAYDSPLTPEQLVDGFCQWFLGVESREAYLHHEDLLDLFSIFEKFEEVNTIIDYRKNSINRF
jgi:hypothetical protein